MNFTWHEFLPLLFMGIMGLALLVYAALDGYDLGVGLLLPLAEDDEKDLMVASIGPFWDANETWLVLGIGVLLVAFPKAHGIILGALYLPVAFMLLGLILRGAAYDFRVKAHSHFKPLWNSVFAAGSAITALAQGWMLGRYITGFSEQFWTTLFCVGIALTLPAAYALLGSGWLIMKTEGRLQEKAVHWGQKLLWPMGLMLVGISLATPLISATVRDKWFVLPQLIALLAIPLACVGAFWAIHHTLHNPRIVRAGYGWIVFAGTVLIFLMSFLGLAYSIYPNIVIDRLTIWQAASATESLAVIAIGVAITLPIIIAYTIFMYRVFWGKAQALSYDAPNQ